MSSIIGIDLGTTNSCVAIMDGKNPKVITFDKDNTINPKANIYKNNPIILSKKDISNDPQKNINNIIFNS